MKTYRLTRNGMTFDVQLSDEDAKRYGAKPLGVEPEVKGVTPRNKQRTARNRAVPAADK